jgi:hypothetical protein
MVGYSEQMLQSCKGKREGKGREKEKGKYRNNQKHERESENEVDSLLMNGSMSRLDCVT